jgi:cupin fold WbuC family metalloprotein
MQVSPGVFYTKEAFVLADAMSVDFLREQARSTELKRARLCAHPDPFAEQHDMLIASHRDTYVTPHRHLSKTESFLVIEGEADILLFEADGQLTDVIAMSDASSGLPFFYRMPRGQYHSLRIRSEVLVFVESSKGPFQKADMEDAPFAPAGSERQAGRAFIGEAIHAFQRGAR